MTTPAAPLSPEYVFLGLLAQQPAHGYDLHQTVLTELGHLWHIPQNQAYNILARLEQRGFIKGTLRAQAKLPARRIFHITASGRRHFEVWLSASAGGRVRAIRLECLTRLYFAQARGPETSLYILEAQLADARAGLERLQQIQSDLPPEQVFNRLGMDLRIRQLSATLEWLEECRSALGLTSASP